MKTLEVEKRDAVKTPEEIRKEGGIPAVYYGKKTESTPVFVSMIKFKKIWKEMGGSSVFNIKDGNTEMSALIHDVQLHPVTDEPVHADFYIVEKGQTVKVSIPIEFIRESPAVKNLGGALVKVLHEIEVEAAPSDLPHEIVVDISGIVEIDGHIAVKDLKFPTGVKTTEEPEEIIVLVEQPKEEEPVVVEADLSSIEVEKKGKEEKEDDTQAQIDADKTQINADKK
ncbi:50S ribosomal protein L25 [Patescibacteria group bacterium]|nr:50S ribosomal protein L25 [Patescibacteria group bacterium]MBU4057793.1 50S ribosomal protein L25 [Patescibacteria group bacterium]MBU4115969.1 50S ribosomal protein L25 [Patescibacteria group bacterium]